MPPFAPKKVAAATAKATKGGKRNRPAETHDEVDEDESLGNDVPSDTDLNLDTQAVNGDESDEDVDGEFEEDEAHSNESKPKKRKTNGADARFRAPTAEEMLALRETSDLFQSNLFKLQIDELLKEVSLDYTKTGNLDKALHGIKAVLDSCKDVKEMDFEKAVAAMRKQGLEIPFPRGNGQPSLDKIQYKFSFKTPEKVFIAGSYLIKTVTKSRGGINVDMAVQMPDAIFAEKDHMNNRYFNKRAYYLAVIASALKTSPQFSNITFEHFNNDPRRPVIVIQSADKSTGFGHIGGQGGVQIRILPVVNPDLFAVHKLAPGRNNNRPLDASDSSSASLPATPRYNTSLLMDTLFVQHLNALHKHAAACPAFRDAVILGKVWLNQRGLSDNGFTGFLWSLIIVYLMGQGNRVNKSTGIQLRESFSSYQIVKLTIEFLASHNFADEPLFMTADGRPIDHPDFSAKSFTQQFDCVLVDSTGKVNLAAFVNASTLNHLQFEARASLSLFNDLGSDKFDSLFLKNLTEPIGYFDLVVRIENVPHAFAAYKSSVQLDFPSKRQFFAHFVPRLLRLGIKSRTRLIKLTDSHERKRWDVSENVPMEGDDSALYVGLVLDYERAIEVVEQGPSSGEDAKAVENFRRLWGTRSSLRRFNDGSIVESVVWDERDGSLDDRVLLTGRMAVYLLSRHVNVDQDEMTFWGGQFARVLKEFGSHESLAGAEKRDGTFQSATDAFNAFAKAIKGLDGIPLDVNAVLACDAGLRYSSVFIPQPSFAGDSSNRLTPILRDQMEVLIELESSAKWPDTVSALQHMKLAFYCKIAELISKQVPGSLATVTKPDLMDLTTGWLNVRMPSGYSFRARIRTGVELGLANATLHAASQSGDSHLKYSSASRAEATEKIYRTVAAHTLRFQNLHFKFPQLSTTVRLVKRWISAHWLSNHFSDEAIEILVAKVFTDIAPFPAAPSCAFAGFLRVLELLWKWDWEQDPLIVEFEKGEISAEKRTEIQTKFGDGSKKSAQNAGGVMCLATSEDLAGAAWTQSFPSLIVLKRLRQLAKASFKVLKDAVASGDDTEVSKIFVTPTSGYDFVVELDVTKIPKYHQSITYDEDLLPQHKSKFKNLAALEKNPLQRFLESFNPVESYIHDLQSAFGETMAFFYDQNGGDKIGILLNKKLVIPQQPWKVNIPFTVKVLEEAGATDESNEIATKSKGKGGKKESGKKKAMVVPDRESISAEIERLGSGLVVSVITAE